MVRMVGRSHPNVFLQDGRELSSGYAGPATLDDASQAASLKAPSPLNGAQPLALASGDFNADGFPDLVTGYASPSGGIVTLHRGNPKAFAPDDPDVLQNTAGGRFPDPFLKQASVFELPEVPDFLGAGDFDRDGKFDVMTAARGGNTLYLLSGEGRGQFSAPQRIALPGAVTAMLVGEMNRIDGLTDVVVGINMSSGPALLVYDGATCVLKATPAVHALPSEASSLALGRLNDDGMMDLAIRAGDQVLLLHGRSQSGVDDPTDKSVGGLEPVALPFAVTAMALGDFIWDREARTEMAVLAKDGTAHIVARGQLEPRPLSAAEIQQQRRMMTGASETKRLISAPVRTSRESLQWEVVEDFSPAAAQVSTSGSSPTLLVGTHISGHSADDLLIMNPAARRLQLLYQRPRQWSDSEVSAQSADRVAIELDAVNEPVAAMPMRLNVNSRPGLVILNKGRIAPTLVMAMAATTITVNDATDTIHSPGCATTGTGTCSLRDAVIFSNANAGADMIVFSPSLNGTPHTLTIANVGVGNNNEDAALTGDLDVHDSVTIIGNGSANTIIQAGTNTTNGIDKVFGLNPFCDHVVDVSISGVTIRFGRNTQPLGAPDFSFTGGGVDWCGFGTSALTITDSVISSNTNVNAYGGGINLDSLPGGNGTITFTNTTVTNNTSLSTGGGISVLGDAPPLTLTNCVISNNTTTGSGGNGGGLLIRHASGGLVAIHSSTISGNTAKGVGGGIAIAGGGDQPVLIDLGTSITGNTSQDGPGGSSQGGGLFNSNPSATTTTLTNVSITNNHADVGSSAQGGGIFVESGTLNMNTGSITNNTAGSGGGIAVTGGTVSLTNLTMTTNSATGNGGAVSVGGGSLTANLNRLVSNSAASGSGIAQTGGTASVENNWWGCDGFPSAAGCETGSGTFDADPRLDLRLTASPSTISTGGTTTLTADVTKNSDGTTISPTPSVLVGLNLTFASGPLGSINAPLTVAIPGSGIVTKTFTAGATPGTAMPTVTLDNGTETTSITIEMAANQLTAVGPANVWIGLKNSDDVGTKFDLLAEVFKNGALVGSGQLDNVPGGSSGFNNAVQRTITMALSGGPVAFSSGDTLSFKLSVRIAVGVSGHRSGTARLWFNDSAANSRFATTISAVTADNFLLDGFVLGASAGPGPKKTIDVLVDRAVGGNPFKPFGTWNKTF
jgi:hypothetical protein